jgi:signal peptidase I
VINPGDVHTAGAGRLRRVAAVVLSLVMPGAGHFLLGAFRRGVGWAVGLTSLGLLLVFAAPISPLFVIILIVVIVGLGGRVAAAFDAARTVRPRPSWKTVIVAWAALLVGSLAADLVVVEPLKTHYKTHYAQAFTIPSGAMQPTLLVGDSILVDKSAYRDRAPRRGDIVVFRYPQDERRDFVKRIVGTPGETVQIRGQQVFINGQPIDEPYVRHDPAALGTTGTSVCRYAYACDPLVVPPRSYFVMGDNRDNSLDSRYWGFVTRDQIKGKASVVYWSWDRDRHRVRVDRIWRSL